MNREVSRALRAYDLYVFGRDAPVKPVPAHHTMEGTKRFGRNDTDKKGDGRDASEKEG